MLLSSTLFPVDSHYLWNIDHFHIGVVQRTSYGVLDKFCCLVLLRKKNWINRQTHDLKHNLKPNLRQELKPTFPLAHSFARFLVEKVVWISCTTRVYEWNTFFHITVKIPPNYQSWTISNCGRLITKINFCWNSCCKEKEKLSLQR